MEEQNCPLMYDTNIPIITSKGRNALTLALQKQSVDIARFLVVEQGMDLGLANASSKYLRMSVLTLLEKALQRIPAPDHSTTTASAPGTNPDSSSSSFPNGMTVEENDVSQHSSVVLPPATAPSVIDSSVESNGLHHLDGFKTNDSDNGLDCSDDTITDSCIVCFEKSIDCVITPCGHQVCCLSCGEQLEVCPICNQEFTLLRIFRS